MALTGPKPMQERAQELAVLRQRGVLDAKLQAAELRVSVGHMRRIRAWAYAQGIDTERLKKRKWKPRRGDIVIEPLPAEHFLRVTVRLHKALVQRLRANCRDKGVSITSAIETAVEAYLRARGLS